MSRQLPAGTVTLVFTDIEGSTRLLHKLGADRYGEALAEHRRLLRDAFEANGGVEVDTQGDAFFVAFPTAQAAAAAVAAGNEALTGGPIRVRWGLHTGAPTITCDGYVGLDVHRGARIAALAHGGQAVVSPTTAALLDGVPLRDLGRHRLKDFDGAVGLYQLGDDVFPPLRTPGSVELPEPATRFVGREHELSVAVSLVYDRDPRVLTLVGPGGTGKTRFVLELARLLAEDADGGTVFVALAPLRDPGLLLQTIADSLGAAAPSVEAIAARIGGKRTHVVCDNIEHLLPAAAGLLSDVVAAAPALRLLVTSREALRVQGEAELDLEPLRTEEAVALFCERAQAVRPDVVPTAAISELCERLDRLPLALELAAARTKLMSPQHLLDRLGDRLDGLRGTRDAEDRHATLRATIEWSYDLLDDAERRLFAQLGVFRGGCTLETAEAVCDSDDIDTLASLLDKSLVRRRTGRRGEDRYWMLETIREFALERLDESGFAIELGRRHAERMLAIARSAHLSEDDPESDVAVVLAERDDHRAALDWAEAHDPELGLTLAVELQNLWNASAPAEGTLRVERLVRLARDIPLELRAAALRVRSGTTGLAGDHEKAERLQRESLALYERLGDDRGIAAVTHMLAVAAWRRQDWPAMRDFTDRSLTLAAGRFPLLETSGYWLMGQLALAEGDAARAAELTLQSAESAARAGWTWWESGQRHELLMLAVGTGDLEEAEREGTAALRMEREQENRLWALYTIAGLAQVAHARGDLRLAGLLWGAAEKEAQRLPRWADERRRRGGPLLDETGEAFVSGESAGRELDLWDAAAVALGEERAPDEQE